MKLIFLYGPPAAGKLTVAKELNKLTGYKIFHNHLTTDLADTIFDWGTKSFWSLVHQYRLTHIGLAAQHKISGLIFTFVYAPPSDNAFIRQVVNRVQKYGGKVYFVRLTCDQITLERRIKNNSRKSFKKLRKIGGLRKLINKYELFTNVPYKNNLIIDTKVLSPKSAALKIKKYYKL